MTDKLNLKNALNRIQETGIVTLTGTEAHELHKLIQNKDPEIINLQLKTEQLRIENAFLRRETLPDGWELRIVLEAEKFHILIRRPPEYSDVKAIFPVSSISDNHKIITELVDTIKQTKTDQGRNIFVDMRQWHLQK